MVKRQAQNARSHNSYARTRYNATKHGALSRVPVLPWEDAEEFTKFQEELFREYAPQGVSEEHLVLEMANCIFRKQRIYRAENALITKSMSNASSYVLKKAVNLLVPDVAVDTSFGSEVDLRSVLNNGDETYQEDELEKQKKYIADVQAVIDSNLSYEGMLNQCPAAAIELWHGWINDDKECGYTPDKESFKEFLATEIVEWCEKNLNEDQVRPHLRHQLIGLSYIPNSDTEQLQRHETTLDRRFEKCLAMLMKLQEVRAMKASTTILDQSVNSVNSVLQKRVCNV